VRCRAYFDILNCLGVTDECESRTNTIDGRTDILIENAELKYVVRPKKLIVYRVDVVKAGFLDG